MSENKGNLVTVKAVRSFMGEEGDKDWNSEPFEVTRQRAADLKANGLVEIVKEEKAAEAPSNKMEREPSNKADGDEKPSRRGTK